MALMSAAPPSIDQQRLVPVRISVLGGFRVESQGADISMSAGSQRLLAFLAIQRNPAMRVVTAGTLWPEATDSHAFASLRSTLARLEPGARLATSVSPSEVHLATDVVVDLRDSQDLARRVLDPNCATRASDLDWRSISLLSSDLLPGWYDDWVIGEAEGWRQLRLHALESLAVRYIAEERFGEAAESALAAITAEPLRESSHRTLMRVHLAEGNKSEAVKGYERYRELLSIELGLEPSGMLREFLAAVVRS